MIAIIDYGAGNLQSVKKALDFIGAESLVTSRASEIENASACILPGVGSFGDAMNFRRIWGLKFRTSGGIPQTSKSLALYMTALQTARLSILFIPIISTPKIARTSLRKQNTEFRSILPWRSPK